MHGAASRDPVAERTDRDYTWKRTAPLFFHLLPTSSMPRTLPFLAAILAVTAAGTLPAQTPAPPPQASASPELLPPGMVIEKAGARIRTPRGWQRHKDLEMGPHLIHLVGDGVGIPPVDDRGSPLQAGLAVERFTDEAASLVARLESASARRRMGEMEREAVELAGGLRGTVLYSTLARDDGRKSFYEQLVIADPQKGTWLVTAWIVGSADSLLPTRGSALEQRLATFVRSFELIPEAGR